MKMAAARTSIFANAAARAGAFAGERKEAPKSQSTAWPAPSSTTLWPYTSPWTTPIACR